MRETGPPKVLGADTFRLCFVGGVFGAGKSTLCQEIARTLPARHVKASELIQFQPQSTDSTGKAVDRVHENQKRLVEALDALRLQAGIILLDGHYCLWNSNHSVIPVSLETFRRLNPSALVLVDVAAHAAVGRLYQRDGNFLDPGLLQTLLEAERAQARAVAAALDVPLVVTGGSSSPRNLSDQLRSVLGGF